ncbi:MAG: hypothetical protein RMJ35_00345 [Phycisphaerales bacterium]|nr:hypothetical protein [Phycisphaerales bacterium]
MLHYCWMRVRHRDWPDLHRKLGAALAAKIALWDPVVADFLLEHEFGELMRPDVPLQEYARLREWHNGSRPNDPMEAWAWGMMDIVEGRWRLHPALLLNGTDSAELRSRVWSAQVSVLMPMLEEERRSLIERHRRHLRLPYRTLWGLVECAEDLELQHLSKILSAVPQVDPATQKKARRLGRIRNRLAHLEPLDMNDLDTL